MWLILFLTISADSSTGLLFIITLTRKWGERIHFAYSIGYLTVLLADTTHCQESHVYLWGDLEADVLLLSLSSYFLFATFSV